MKHLRYFGTVLASQIHLLGLKCPTSGIKAQENFRFLASGTSRWRGWLIYKSFFNAHTPLAHFLLSALLRLQRRTQAAGKDAQGYTWTHDSPESFLIRQVRRERYPEKATFDRSGYSRDTCHKLSGCSALIFQPLLYLNLDDISDLSLRNDSYVPILPITGKVDTRARVENCNLPYPISSKYKGYSEITKCQTEIRQSAPQSNA